MEHAFLQSALDLELARNLETAEFVHKKNVIN